MSKIEVTTIDAPSGSTEITVGSTNATGGVTISKQKWLEKSGAYTATSGDSIFIDTSSSAVTITLPSSPTIGDFVTFKDATDSFDTNNLTVARNGSNIEGSAADLVVSTESAGFTLVYYNTTRGWLIKDV
jgi:hypothetical protein